MRIILILSALLLFTACKSDVELTLERGIQYFEWNILDKAIIEFNQVVRLLSSDFNRLTRYEIEMLSKAHHNLAVSYLKKEWLDAAEQEARKAFKIMPTEENRTALAVIHKERKKQQEK